MLLVKKKEFYQFSGHMFVSGISSVLFQFVDFLMIMAVSISTASVISYADSIYVAAITLGTGFLSPLFSEFSKEKPKDGILYTSTVYTIFISLLFLLPVLLLQLISMDNWFTFDETIFKQYLGNRFSIVILMLLYSVLEIGTRLTVTSKKATQILITSLSINALFNYLFLFHYKVFAPETTVILSAVVSRVFGITLFCKELWHSQKDLFKLNWNKALIKKYNSSFSIGIKNSMDWAGGAIVGTALGTLSGPAFTAYQIFYRGSVIFYRLPQAMVSAAHKEYAKHSENKSPSHHDLHKLRNHLNKLIGLPTLAIGAGVVVILWVTYLLIGNSVHSETIFYLSIFSSLEMFALWYYIQEQVYSTYLICHEKFKPLSHAGFISFTLTALIGTLMYFSSKNVLLVFVSELLATVVVSIFLRKAFIKSES